MNLAERWSSALMPTYPVPSVALVKGEGAVVTDDAGRTFLDLYGGIAVNALGHGHPAVVQAVTRQVSTLGHVSNFVATVPVAELAERLLQLGGRDGRVFFTNSGAEANEAAFKLSRRTGRRHVVAATGAFHGRTMGALALTGQPGKAAPFAPLPGEVTHVPYGDAEALAAAVTDDTAMVILEPVQGENGVIVPPAGYLAAARAVTRQHGALLALDEVQTGIGRLGYWLGHQAPAVTGSPAGVAGDGTEPDVVTLAKGLGGGLPIGACVGFGPAADLFDVGTHGTTFGGNPVCCAAALAVLDTIEADGLLAHVRTLGERISRGVSDLAHPLVAEVRGTGLLLGVALTSAVAGDVTRLLQQAGFLVNPVQPDVVRLAPPLTLTEEQADDFLTALPSALDRATEGSPVPAGGTRDASRTGAAV